MKKSKRQIRREERKAYNKEKYRVEAIAKRMNWRMDRECSDRINREE